VVDAERRPEDFAFALINCSSLFLTLILCDGLILSVYRRTTSMCDDDDDDGLLPTNSVNALKAVLPVAQPNKKLSYHR